MNLCDIAEQERLHEDIICLFDLQVPYHQQIADRLISSLAISPRNAAPTLLAAVSRSLLLLRTLFTTSC